MRRTTAQGVYNLGVQSFEIFYLLYIFIVSFVKT